MKIRITKGFSNKLLNQVEFIAQDKPKAAKKFSEDILKQIEDLKKFPFKNRTSIYGEDSNIRDLIFKAYVITYLVKENEGEIVVFALTKYEDKK